MLLRRHVRSLTHLHPLTQAAPTAVGDSAPYTRRAPSLDDAVIVSALRTPITKVCVREREWKERRGGEKKAKAHTFPPSSPSQAKRGGFKDTLPDDMLAAVVTATLQRTGVEPEVRVRGGCVCV